MANNTFEYDVALSFAREDKAITEEFARLLMNQNVKVFYDEYTADSLWGKDVVDHLVNLYARKAQCCVLFISRHYPLKAWTKAERKAAQERSFRDANEYIILIRVGDAQVPGMTEPESYRDLGQHSMESIADLIKQKLTETKTQLGPPPQSHDLRSGNVPSSDQNA